MKSFFKSLLIKTILVAAMGLTASVAAMAQQPAMVTLTEQTFLTKCYNYNADEVKCNKPFIIEFGAEWCTWCKKQKPVLQKIQALYGSKIQTFYVDVDLCPQAASLFDEIESGIPCLVFVKPDKGGEYESINGYMDEQELKQAIKEVFGF